MYRRERGSLIAYSHMTYKVEQVGKMLLISKSTAPQSMHIVAHASQSNSTYFILYAYTGQFEGQARV